MSHTLLARADTATASRPACGLSRRDGDRGSARGRYSRLSRLRIRCCRGLVNTLQCVGTRGRGRRQARVNKPRAPAGRPRRPASNGLTSRCEHSQKGPCMRYGTQHADVAIAELETALAWGPFHVALRAASAARGLPLQRVQRHLSRYGVKVGVTSLSYWQQGARRPQRPESLRAVRALEEILQLPDESLIRLLAKAEEHMGPQRPAGRSYRSLVEASSVLERLLAELDSPVDGGLHTIGHHERVRIGADRQLLGRESHHIVRAHKDGVDRYMAIHHGDPGCAPERT